MKPSQPYDPTAAVAHLRAVDGAVPRRAAVHQLVAQHVEAIEHRAQDPHRVERADGGLGLALARDLLAIMGGSISLDATSDHGSTFIVRMPLHDGRM